MQNKIQKTMKKFIDLEKGDKVYYVDNLDSYEKGIIKEYDVINILNTNDHLEIVINTCNRYIIWIDNEYRFESAGIEFVDKEPLDFILGPYVATSKISLHKFINNCLLCIELEKKIKLR